jgi:hypothetical protein
MDVDVYMASSSNSPPHIALQGASHTTGGVLCGRAQGNVFNHADGGDVMFDLQPRKGRVHVYTSPKDPSAHKPDMSLTSEVTPTLKPILKTLARSYSLVRSEYIINYYGNHFYAL